MLRRMTYFATSFTTVKPALMLRPLLAAGKRLPREQVNAGGAAPKAAPVSRCRCPRLVGLDLRIILLVSYMPLANSRRQTAARLASSGRVEDSCTGNSTARLPKAAAKLSARTMGQRLS